MLQRLKIRDDCNHGFPDWPNHGVLRQRLSYYGNWSRWRPVGRRDPEKADYKSAKSTVLSCGVFSIWVFGNFAPIFLNRESYMVMLTEGYGAEYAATLNTYMPMWIAPILLVACFVFGLVGGMIGKAICKSTSSVPVLHNGAGNSAQQKTEQGLRLDPRTKLLLIFIISILSWVEQAEKLWG